MKCDCGYIFSGDFCDLCGKVFKPKKESVKAINKVGKRRSKEVVEYTNKKKKFLEENPRCSVFPRLKATTIHHKKGRLGSLFLDERYWLGVSMKGHRLIEDNPGWSYKMGYSLLRLDKTDDVI